MHCPAYGRMLAVTRERPFAMPPRSDSGLFLRDWLDELCENNARASPCRVDLDIFRGSRVVFSSALAKNAKFSR